MLQVIRGLRPEGRADGVRHGPDARATVSDFARATRLDGVRIGVVREYMDKALFTKMDEQTIDIVSGAAADLNNSVRSSSIRARAARCSASACKQYNPQMHNELFTRQFPELFPVEDDGKPRRSHRDARCDGAGSDARARRTVDARSRPAQATGESRYMMNRYLASAATRPSRATRTSSRSRASTRPAISRRKRARERQEETKELDMADRMLTRFAVQQMVLQCMAVKGLDALTYPTRNLPPPKLGAPTEPTMNGRWRSRGACSGARFSGHLGARRVHDRGA